MSQTQKLQELLSDNRPHSTIEIMEYVYGNDHLGLARVGARVYDLTHKHAFRVVGWHDSENPAIYWYAHIPFEWNEWYDEAIRLGMSARDAYYATLQKSQEAVRQQEGLFV
jgi:hypothetical protein